MLLKLAEALVKRAKDNSTNPVPLLFSLSSWKNDNQNIKDWLIEQLKDKYGLRKDISKLWIENQEIIPLLDGLDELAAERQEKCVFKINEFLLPKNWNNPVIVCSRVQEYQRYTSLLHLNNSLELSPFSPQQVEQYLQSTGQLQLWSSISHDADLSQLAKTPLLLNIIVLSATEISIQTWQQFKSSEERLSYLFDAYIRRIFKRTYKGKNKQPKEENTKRWLSWLAYRLIEESATEFLIEKMQPDWLKNRGQKIIYNLIVWGVIGALISGLIFGLISGINGLEVENKVFPNQGIRQSVINTIKLSLVISLFGSLISFRILIFSRNYELDLENPLLSGILFGTLVGILRSGTPAIKHFILRVILWFSGSIPWNYAKFLNYCTNRLFLQRVGGGYRFMHDLLRQHFAKSYTQISLAPVQAIPVEPSPQVQNHLVCTNTNCGHNNPVSSNFCIKCGTKLTKPHI